MTKELMEKEAIFAGISAGAVVRVALKVAERLDEGNVVALLADGGWKYLSTSLWTMDWGQPHEEVQGKIWW
jgi:cysteine synthase B